MKTLRISFVTVVLVLLCQSPICWGFPGPPQPIVQRWTDANVVIYANVASVKEREYGGQIAVLSTIEVLKGQAEGLPKEVPVFTRGGGCPYPFVFREDEKIIAFLRFDAMEKMYSPPRSHEGCIAVDDRAYARYSAALKKLPAILNHPEMETRNRLLLEWYVDCAVQAETRWDGALGIECLPAREESLTNAQKERLVAAIISETPPLENTSSLVRVLAPYPSVAFDKYLLESLRRSHEKGWEDLTRNALETLPTRLGIKLDSSTQQRQNEWGELLGRVYYEIDKEKDRK